MYHSASFYKHFYKCNHKIFGTNCEIFQLYYIYTSHLMPGFKIHNVSLTFYFQPIRCKITLISFKACTISNVISHLFTAWTIVKRLWVIWKWDRDVSTAQWRVWQWGGVANWLHLTKYCVWSGAAPRQCGNVPRGRCGSFVSPSVTSPGNTRHQPPAQSW